MHCPLCYDATDCKESSLKYSTFLLAELSAPGRTETRVYILIKKSIYKTSDLLYFIIREAARQGRDSETLTPLFILRLQYPLKK